MNVLIVDDSKGMRMIVKRTLKKAGFDDWAVQEASDGAEALQAIRASVPDLVLSDWNMPKLSGIELLRALNAENIAVKFGFVTSTASEAMRTAALEEGALFLLAKPFTAEMFKYTIDAVLGKGGESGAVPGSVASAMWVVTLPTAEKVAAAFSRLLPRKVRVNKRFLGALPKDVPMVVATYVQPDNDTLRFVCICDLNLAASVGAALTLFPPQTVKESLKDGRLHQNLMENLHEVLDVLGNLFRGSGSSSLALRAVYAPGQPLPKALSNLLLMDVHRE